MTRKIGIVASGVLLGLLIACQPASLPGTPATGAGTPGVVVVGSPLTGAAITVAVSPTIGMGTRALPKTAADVVMYEITLHKVSDNSLVATLRIAGSTPTGQFIGVPAGDYYIKADAFSDGTPGNPGIPGSVSLVQGPPAAPIRSVNDVNVLNGVATYTNPTVLVPAPTSLVVNLPLLNGTQGTGASNVTVANRTVVLPGADRSVVALYNRASRRASVNAANPSVTYTLTNVQTGASTGQTHEVWAFAAENATSKASVPKPFGTGANPAGTPVASIAVTHAAQTLETGPTAITVAAGHNLVVDQSNNLFYYNGTEIRNRPSTGNYPSDALVMDNSAGALTGWTATQDALIFFSTGTDIKLRTTTVATAGTLAVTAANVGKMTADEGKNLYYIDTATNKVKRAVFNGTAYIAPVDAMTPGGTPTMLAVDAYGSIYTSDGTNIKKAALDTDEATYLAPATVVTAAGITSICVDRVGNMYFTDASNAVKMVNAGETTIYTIAGPGTGVGADALAGVIPTGTNLAAPNAVTMSITGRLLFTSLGAANRFLRYVP
jgi:hypothetical protein